MRFTAILLGLFLSVMSFSVCAEEQAVKPETSALAPEGALTADDIQPLITTKPATPAQPTQPTVVAPNPTQAKPPQQ